jgi:hypothetical protein
MGVENREPRADRQQRKNLEWDVGSWGCALGFLLVALAVVVIIVGIALTLEGS